ncbi:MAG: phage replisome organizer N-terminal domain-containing protein [Clostridia bacterium]|nr:phage replisome organizer N-terminal domain-containing protein [Clostridia bacterium]
MSEKRYYWLKLYDTFFENKTSKYLRKLPDGDKILLVYLKFQLKLLKSEGIFVYENLCDSVADEIALTLDEDVNTVKLLLAALDKTKAIEYLNENTFMLSEMQDLIGSEGSSAARVRKHRNKYKALQSNTSVTSSNGEVTNLLRRDRYRDR